MSGLSLVTGNLRVSVSKTTSITSFEFRSITFICIGSSGSISLAKLS